jgi:hypothetical protein
MKINEVSKSVDQVSFGTLQVHVTSEKNGQPIGNALVQVYSNNDFTSSLYDLRTDISGNTVVVQLPAPPIEFSQQPSNEKPYSEYNLRITAPGYQTVEIYGTQIFPTIGSTQPVEMADYTGQKEAKVIRIGPNILYGK